MPKKITSQDIEDLINEAKRKKDREKGNFTSKSDITPFVGKLKDKIVLAAGLKLKHKKTGLTYTVTDVDFQNGDIIMNAVSGNNLLLAIPSAQFKSYERL
jgi:hypothetical protein